LVNYVLKNGFTLKIIGVREAAKRICDEDLGQFDIVGCTFELEDKVLVIGGVSD
jgi:hypothetical protein